MAAIAEKVSIAETAQDNDSSVSTEAILEVSPELATEASSQGGSEDGAAPLDDLLPALVTAAPEETDTDISNVSPSAAVVAAVKCPEGHELKLANAPAGKCNGCDRRVIEGQVVLDCRACNYYLCITCRPDSVCQSEHAASTHCPRGHALKLQRAHAGTCDGCGLRVVEDQPVMNCGQCNWYLCAVCRPIPECPKGHALRTSMAVAGKCDGCSRRVKQGEAVSDCQVCNWYLCSICQPSLQQVASPAALYISSQRAGKCALCKTPTAQEDVTIASNGYVWHLCTACSSQRATGRCALCSKATVQNDTAITAHGRTWQICSVCKPVASPARMDGETAQTSPLPQCARGHPAVPKIIGSRKSCSECSREIRKGEMASRCIPCNWQLCVECHPIRQCTKGHKLEARPAVAGTCDGCHKRVKENQCVLDCKHCNWYLCGGCHLSAARGGA